MKSNSELVSKESLASLQTEMDDMKFDLLREYFNKNGLDERQIISESDLWFYDTVLKNNPNNFFHLVFAKGSDVRTQKIQVSNLLVNITIALNDLEMKIKKLQHLEDEITEKGKNLHSALEQINEKEDDYDHQGQKFSFSQDTIGISYTINERATYGVFNKKHPLTYKVGLSENEVKTIHQENSDKVASLKVDASTQFIYIKVFAIINKTETEVAIKQLPIEEVYTAHSPKVLAYKEVPPAYLIIPYDADSGIVEAKEVELKFDFNLTFELRVKILRNLILINEGQRMKRTQQKNDAIQRLDDILAPFDPVLKYKPETGFYKNKKGSRACDSCSLF